MIMHARIRQCCILEVFAFLTFGFLNMALAGGGQEIEAFVASQRFVEQRLKAPSSADFCSYTDANVEYLGNGRYRVIAYVDSQNSFGAELRTRYKCILKHEGGYDWYLEGLSF